MPYRPWFPEPGSYIKYRHAEKKEITFRRLEWRRDPFKYPMRLSSLAAGTKQTNPTVFEDLNPSETKKHIYLAYLGVKPGFIYYLWHPFDIKNLKWDERIEDVDEDTVANIGYEESPYEYPTKALGIEHDRYPAIQPYNVSGSTKTPEIIWMAALYVVKNQEDLSEEEVSKLRSGSLRSYPWDFGGEL